MINAKIIADSINRHNKRIITYIVTFPCIVLSEFNTHRTFSRNSASRRAIPFNKMVKMVQENPFIPIAWQKDHKGMQGAEYYTDKESIEKANTIWLYARDSALKSAKALNTGTWEHGINSEPIYKYDINITKQLCNRLLEPFMYHTAIVTSTEWENFFALRAHPDAEIHIADLAQKMLDAANSSIPKKLNDGEWHIPFGDSFDLDRMINTCDNLHIIPNDANLNIMRIKIATARCARVSYLNFDGTDDYEADYKLVDRLAKAGHFSPFEHCARVMDEYEISTYYRTSPTYDSAGVYEEFGWCGNFRTYIQYRKMFDNENKTDDRYIKKSFA